MTDKELNALRLALQAKRLKITGALNPMMMMGDIKAAATMGAEITEELAARELRRQGEPLQ